MITARSVRPQPGARRLSAEAWLLAATQDADRAHAEWLDGGAAWVRPDDQFTAVVVRAGVMHQAVGRPGPVECAQTLADVLGPVFYRAGEFGPEGGYTVLLPASAARSWRARGTVVVPPSAQVLVPAPDRLEPAPEAPWWVVPLAGPDALCTPAALASLLAQGEAVADTGEDDDA